MDKKKSVIENLPNKLKQHRSEFEIWQKSGVDLEKILFVETWKPLEEKTIAKAAEDGEIEIVNAIIKEIGDHLSKRQKNVFTNIYEKNHWQGSESRSGTGSNLEQTMVVKKELPKLLRKISAQSILDCPCGDFAWMQHLTLDIDRYIGADIVETIIKKNQRQFGDQTRTFCVLDLTKDELPNVDVIFCRDCLVHFSYEDFWKAIRNLKNSGTTYLLTTTFPNRGKNSNIITSGWRPLNLEIAPINFGKPIEIINEECTEGGGAFSDKSLALWRIEDLPSSEVERKT